MENKNQTIIIALLALIIGLILGYFLSMHASPWGFFSNGMMQGEIDEHMYEDEIISGDGAMIHAMDEMMLEFRGKTGEEYEEAFLRGMIVHHIGAVRMAEGLLEQTARPELMMFAQDTIKAQEEEVDTMKGWLENWFNNKN